MSTSSVSFFTSLTGALLQRKKHYLMRNLASIGIVVCLLIWLMDVFYWSTQERRTDVAELVNQNPREAREASLASLKHMRPLNLMDSIELPQVPAQASIKIQMNRVAQSNMLAPSLVTEKSKSLQRKSKTSDQTDGKPIEMDDNAQEVNEAHQRQAMEPSIEARQAVTNRMLAMNSKDIRFLLPLSTREKESFLKHMYRCENMQFGAISDSEPMQLSLLSKPSPNMPQSSQLLRIAHDYLSKYEHTLIKVYAQRSLPIRIFTAKLDNKLAEKMAMSLNGKELTQFSGRYYIDDAKVGLKDLMLNNHKISEQWVLSSNRCLSLY